jgi:putative oxidoreductase
MVTAEDIGKLILRLTTAGLLLFHGSYKVFNEIDSTLNMVEASGLPRFLGFGSIMGEFVAPIFVLLGYKTRVAAIVIAINMLATILVAHRDIILRVNDYWGWMIELNVFFLGAALTISFLGPVASAHPMVRGGGINVPF